MIKMEWNEFKDICVTKNLSMQKINGASAYYLEAWDGPRQIKASILISDPKGADQLDFETNFLPTINGLIDKNKTVMLQALPEPEPFAKPSYRTKRDKTSTWQTITAGQSIDVDYVMSSEKYVSGGEIIYSGAKIGDFIKASVVDDSGVIPEIYRATLCESWPLVNEYINGEWISPNGSSEEFKSKIISTYPLNAKISPGLILRVTYTASEEVGDRQVAVNYHLTKKL